jgi:hypothetical protein
VKTTIDIPEPLYRQVKVKAAQEGVTLRELLLAAITRGLKQQPPVEKAMVGKHFEIDELGIPLLKRPKEDKAVITEDFLNQLREEEGI